MNYDRCVICTGGNEPNGFRRFHLQRRLLPMISFLFYFIADSSGGCIHTADNNNTRSRITLPI